jgi:hypothetical protein
MRRHHARPVRDYANNSNVCTHINLITTLLQRCLYVLQVYFVVLSSTGDVSSVGGNGKVQEFVIVQEWVTYLLIGLEVPVYVLVTYKGEKKSRVCAERPASSRVHAVIVTQRA